jgi:hypothetical protein
VTVFGAIVVSNGERRRNSTETVAMSAMAPLKSLLRVRPTTRRDSLRCGEVRGAKPAMR